jgi:protein-disulfide isomerase
MKKWVNAVWILTLVVLPAAAQEPLPAGCNVSTLSEIFTNVGASLVEEELTPQQAVFIIDALDSALTATRNACLPDADGEMQGIDYSAIRQSRTEDGAFVLGDEAAPITIVEFADFLCPHCQTYHATMQQVIEEYVASGQAKFEYRMFPVVDPNVSPALAAMVECADILNPGGFWHAHDVMYELAEAGFTGLTPFTFAARTGMGYDTMVTCVEESAGQVQTDTEFARAVGISGTPSVLVRYGDGEVEAIVVDGNTVNSASVPYMVLSAVIEAAQTAE